MTGRDGRRRRGGAGLDALDKRCASHQLGQCGALLFVGTTHALTPRAQCAAKASLHLANALLATRSRAALHGVLLRRLLPRLHVAPQGSRCVVVCVCHYVPCLSHLLLAGEKVLLLLLQWRTARKRPSRRTCNCFRDRNTPRIRPMPSASGVCSRLLNALLQVLERRQGQCEGSAHRLSAAQCGAIGTTSRQSTVCVARSAVLDQLTTTLSLQRRCAPRPTTTTTPTTASRCSRRRPMVSVARSHHLSTPCYRAAVRCVGALTQTDVFASLADEADAQTPRDVARRLAPTPRTQFRAGALLDALLSAMAESPTRCLSYGILFWF